MSQATFHFWWINGRGEEGGGGTHADRFPYWSFTKTVIAICALKLQETGSLDLAAPLQGARYTLRQLLNHTAGLPDYRSLLDYHRDVARDEEPWPREKLLERALAQGPVFAPGEGWYYSNVGYMLARDHLEAVSGQTFARLVEDMICRPLALPSIELATTRADFAGLHWRAARQYHPGWVYHGCLTGTVQDAARLLHGLFSGQLLSSGSREEMLARRVLGGAIQGRPWTLCGYGLGLMTGGMGSYGEAIGHSGAGPFSVNAIYHFPDSHDRVTVASFCAGHDEGPAEEQAARLSAER